MNCHGLLHLKLLQFVLGVLVEETHLCLGLAMLTAVVVRGEHWLLWRLYRSGLRHPWDMSGSSTIWANAVERNQSNLIMNVKLISVILVEKHLQKGALRVDSDGLQLACLEPGSLVGVQAEEA